MATQKQKRAIDNLVENGGNVSKAMKDAGYSEATAKTPQKLTESKAFQDIYEQYIPNELLLEKHKALLEKVEVVTKNNVSTGEVDVIPTGQIDTQAVKAGLDMAYKVRGMYAPAKHDLTTDGEKIESAPAKVILELEEQLKKKLQG